MKEQEIIDYYFENSKEDVFGVNKKEIYNEFLGKVLGWLGGKLAKWTAQTIAGIRKGWKEGSLELEKQLNIEKGKEVLADIGEAINTAKDGNDLSTKISDIFKKYNVPEKEQTIIGNWLNSKQENLGSAEDASQDPTKERKEDTLKSKLIQYFKGSGLKNPKITAGYATDILSEISKIAKNNNNIVALNKELRNFVTNYRPTKVKTTKETKRK